MTPWSYRKSCRVIFPLFILALASLACALPAVGGQHPAPAATAVQPAGLETAEPADGAGRPQEAGPGQVGPAPVDLPPALVEVDPLPRSELTAGARPVFYFNQPMDRGSVEAAFQVQPGVLGRLEWVDDATVSYVLDEMPGPRQELSFTIQAGAQAANGLPMAEAVEVSYRTPGPLRLTHRLPAPDAVDVAPSSAVVAAFNYPVVPLGVDSAHLPAGFTIDPPAPGRGEWVNTSTYIFYPEPALAGGAQYSVRISPDLSAFAGIPADPDGPGEWRFATAAPRLVSARPVPEDRIWLDASFSFTFNQPMDRSSAEADFSLADASGAAVPGEFSWDESGSEMTFTPGALLKRSSQYTVILIGSAASQGGTLLGESYATRLQTYPALSVRESNPRWRGVVDLNNGYGTVMVRFSAPLKERQDWKSLVSVSPKADNLYFYLNDNGTQLMISGMFAPSTLYDLKISTDLRDRWEGMLDETFFLTFSTSRASPSLVVPALQIGYPVVFIPQGEAEIPARSINVSRINITRGELSLADFIRAQQAGWDQVDWDANIQASWVKLLYLKENVTEQIGIPMTQSGRPLEAGLYSLRVTPGVLESDPPGPPALLVVSPIHMTVKASSRQAFVWAVRMDGYTPAADMVVSFYDHEASILATCATDAQGACQADLPPRKNSFGPIYAVIGLPDDPDFSLSASTWNVGTSAWDFGIRFQPRASMEEVYLYTDRPIYRPGQAVNFRAVLRSSDNGRYTLTGRSEISFRVDTYDPVTFENRLVGEIQLPLTEFGTASGAFSLPQDAAPGTYYLREAGSPGEMVAFKVAEYRKPEVDLQASFARPDYLYGSDLLAGLQARYFFGSPAGNLPVRWVLYALRENAALPDGLSTGKLDLEYRERYPFMGDPGLGFYVMEGSGRTNPDGSLNIAVKGSDINEILEAGYTYRLTMEVTAEDESGLPVSTRGSSRLHPNSIYIGVRPEDWMGAAGVWTNFYVRTLDWQGNSIPKVDLKAHFRKVSWVQEELPSGAVIYRPEYTEAGSNDFYTSEKGEARLAFLPAEAGTFLLEITEQGKEEGSGAVTQQFLWVSGEGSATWPNRMGEQIELQRDSDQYHPGQTAQVFIPNPLGAPALALITVERGRVMQSFVVTIEGSSHTLELPLTEEEAPNVYVSALLLGRQSNRPVFRAGYIELQVDPSSFALDVTVEASPQQPQPGGELALNVRVKDAEGSPVQGEFSLAIVDRAVLALADPNSLGIFDAYYSPRPLEVMTGLLLSNYSRRYSELPGGRGGGGGPDMVQSALRERFEDTAYWNGSVVTGIDGVAQVRLTLPDNLTTWLVDVRGITLDGRVGEGQVDLVTGKPLLVRPVTPRFAVLGDHLELSAVVHNNTGEALPAEVSLRAYGFQLDDPSQSTQTVDLPPGERVQVSWWGTVEDVDALDLVFSASAGSLRDSSRPPLGPVKVLRYTAPQTFSTAGVLVEPGERVEVLGMPRSFTPAGGGLRVETAASTASAVFEGLGKADEFPPDLREAAASELLAHLAAYRLAQDFSLKDEAYRQSLSTVVGQAAGRLERMQNPDGGWGWSRGSPSDPFVTSYVLYTLGRAAQAGIGANPEVLQRAQAYLIPLLAQPDMRREDWELDRLAFQYLALQQAGRNEGGIDSLYELRERLSPWGKASLALALFGANPEDERARVLVSDLQAGAVRYATGIHWEPKQAAWQNWSGEIVTTAAVVEAVARIDPGSPVLVDAARYLVLNRRAAGAWGSSYSAAWVIQALAESARAGGDLGAGFDYSVDLNGSELLSGRMESGQAETNRVWVPGEALQAGALRITRGEGDGRLVYTAALEIARPVENVPAAQRGLSVTRAYYPALAECRVGCQPVSSVSLDSAGPLEVRLTLVVPEDMYNVAIEDWIPAGAEVLNPGLKTSRLGSGAPLGEEGLEANESEPLYQPSSPYQDGWGWWLFTAPQVRDSSIRWSAAYLPAGTYQLTYRLETFLPGEYRVLPARAWLIYFPEVEGISAGSILTIQK